MNIPPLDDMPYRKGTTAIFMNIDREMLLVQKVTFKDNEWDFPGGGIEGDETPEDAIKRELKEELDVSNLEIVFKSQNIYRYEWPEDVIVNGYHKRNKWYRGQERVQFVVKFFGNKEDIKFQEEEIRDIKWVCPKELRNYLVFLNQFETAERLLKEFRI